MNAELLGTAIRYYRRRCRQHNGRAWTLDDFAAATNDDKAHLSRIECGTTLPGRATLLRIAEALSLTRLESEFLLRLAGLSPVVDQPSAESAAVAIRWLAKNSRTYLNPLTLFAADMRVWYSNALWLRLMGINPARFRLCIQGRHMASSYFEDCSTTALVRSRYRNHDEIHQRSVLRFRSALIDGLISRSTLDELLRNEQFRTCWNEMQTRVPQYSLRGEQSHSEVAYPGRGVLRFDTWWCPLEIDPRFIMLLQMPHDVHTRDAIMDMRADPRPEAGAPCPAHGYLCGHSKGKSLLRSVPIPINRQTIPSLGAARTGTR